MSGDLRVNTYHHRYVMQWDFSRHGHYYEAVKLPPYLHVTITENKTTESKFLTVYSRIHVNKVVKINPSYSSDFSDKVILEELSSKIYDMFIK